MEAKWLWVLQYWFVVPALAISFPDHYNCIKNGIKNIKNGIKNNFRPFYWWWWPLIKWLWWWWPLIMVAFVAWVTHQIYLLMGALHPGTINSVYRHSSTLFQFLGPLGVVISLNANMRNLKNVNVFSAIRRWWTEFPLLPRTGAFHSVVSDLTITYGIASLEGTNTATTIEEQVAELQREVQALRDAQKAATRDLEKKIAAVENRTKQEVTTVRGKIAEMEDNLASIAIGGVRFQVFAFLLGTYGLMIPYIWPTGS